MFVLRRAVSIDVEEHPWTWEEVHTTGRSADSAIAQASTAGVREGAAKIGG